MTTCDMCGEKAKPRSGIWGEVHHEEELIGIHADRANGGLIAESKDLYECYRWLKDGATFRLSTCCWGPIRGDITSAKRWRTK